MFLLIFYLKYKMRTVTEKTIWEFVIKVKYMMPLSVQ